MGWEGFMRTERRQLTQRREGQMRRALGIPQAGETTEQLDRIGERDRAKAERGLVPFMGWGDVITYEHLDELSRLNMKSRTTAEWVTVKWLRERLECAKKRASASRT